MIHIKPMFCDANAVILKMGTQYGKTAELELKESVCSCVCVLAYSESSGLLLAVCNCVTGGVLAVCNCITGGVLAICVTCSVLAGWNCVTVFWLYVPV